MNDTPAGYGEDGYLYGPGGDDVIDAANDDCFSTVRYALEHKA